VNETPPPELRRDPVTGRAVLIAPGRATRPMALADALPHHRPPRHRAAEGVFCPFCPGNEWDTPDETYAVREAGSPPNGPGWALRVVPNKYPAVTPDGGPFGFHDVLIPCPAHEPNPARLTVGQLTETLAAVRERFRSFSDDGRVAYAQFFMNVGAEAGASLDHAHGQILATDFVPDDVNAAIRGHVNYEAAHGRCETCARVNPPERLVHLSESAFVVCPYASRFAYEMAVVPTTHRARFHDVADDEFRGIAFVLKRTLLALDAALHEPAYNLVLHSAPFRDAPESYHWHLSIVPRTARAAGYEWGTGVFINTVPPECAATRLREAMARG
jgi:UDPglucose--hexose-1-phosphate uridylyltransferase